ncbi:uncharacterized protein LOC119909307 isoform X2 [Micropterus salmoides]|uniref:uncharacterized protein LOC119909307 isoform X2 n=1 Tax=Micropterus salmoides TaxID=27706 RepID=UPI0018EBB6FC|nr:uncharacterized protein LOC119909307 isoform X2 [Micropterus salmoides]
MASNGVSKRLHMLCPFCRKTQRTMSTHLRRVCMKNGSQEAIEAEMEKAKRDVCELLATGRVFEYALLCQIMDSADPLSRLVEELHRRHMVVIDVPPSLPNVRARPTTRPPPGSAAPETDEDEQSKNDSVCSDETFQRNPDMKLTRQLMAERGLYNKHSLEHPLLKGFATYLEKDLYNENFKQEVENVARFLYYMDPQCPSLDFVRNREKTKEYLHELSEAKLKTQTQLNYLNSLKRFLTYHTVYTNLRNEDEKLHEDCRQFIEYTVSLLKSCSEKVSKEITQARHAKLTENCQLTPHDCLAVLRAAKRDFLSVINKVYPDDSSSLEKTECGLVVYYLEAVVLLKHHQLPGVVEHMTVQEWAARKPDSSGNRIVGVKEHKTAAQQFAMFALSQEEELVRPLLLESKRVKRNDTEGEDRFFISTTGRPIYNASNDLHRLQTKYRVKPVSSQLACRVFEAASKSLVAEQAGDSSAEPADEGSSHPTRGSAGNTPHKPVYRTNVHTDVVAAYDHFLGTHPVTLDGDVPDMSLRCQSSRQFHRKLYERWLKAQMKLRVQHVLSYFCRRLPTEHRVRSWIAKQGWKSNIPNAAQIVKDWKPSGSVDTIMDSRQIQKFTQSQKWRGLQVTETDKGTGVIATRVFQTGEVVCDYHGRVITEQEGKDIQGSPSEEETRNMFFYTDNKGQPMCIDAHSSSCECHPEQQTVGRLINHSKRKDNLRPRLYTVDIDGEEKDVILFLAKKNIQVNGELLFNYGAQKSSFRGKGLDLNWRRILFHQQPARH